MFLTEIGVIQYTTGTQLPWIGLCGILLVSKQTISVSRTVNPLRGDNPASYNNDDA